MWEYGQSRARMESQSRGAFVLSMACSMINSMQYPWALFNACRIRHGLVGRCHSTATTTSCCMWACTPRIACSSWSASCPSLAWPPAHILLSGAWLHCKQMTEVKPWPRRLGTNCCFAALSSTKASSLSGTSFWKEACCLLLTQTRPSRMRNWSSWAH